MGTVGADVIKFIYWVNRIKMLKKREKISRIEKHLKKSAFLKILTKLENEPYYRGAQK